MNRRDLVSFLIIVLAIAYFAGMFFYSNYLNNKSDSAVSPNISLDTGFITDLGVQSFYAWSDSFILLLETPTVKAVVINRETIKCYGAHVIVILENSTGKEENYIWIGTRED